MTGRLRRSFGFAVAVGAPAALGLTVPIAGTGGGLTAQTVVPVHEEPRHHLVLDRPDLRIIDVRIPPGDTTLFHTHDAPIHYVLINASQTTSHALGAGWPERSGDRVPPAPVGTAFWNLEYGENPVTHRVANVGTGLFRLLAVVNRGAGADGEVSTMVDESEAVSRWFRRRRIEIDGSEALTLPAVSGTTVVVQVSEGQLDLAGMIEGLTGPGSWSLFDAGKEIALLNPGLDRVSLVLVEVRP